MSKLNGRKATELTKQANVVVDEEPLKGLFVLLLLLVPSSVHSVQRLPLLLRLREFVPFLCRPPSTLIESSTRAIVSLKESCTYNVIVYFNNYLDGQ